MTTRLDEDAVVSSLDAFSALPEWLVAAMHGPRVSESLSREVPELADGGMQLVACTPERLRAKGDEWQARYKLSVATSEDRSREVVLVGNLAPPSRTAWDEDPTPSDASFGEAGWFCRLPDLGLELRVQESDEALPSLPQIVEPEAVSRLLGPILDAAGYHNAVIASCRPVVVRYKPGSRCTVVVHLEYAGNPSTAAPPTPVVLKTHQGDKGKTAWAAMNALWQRPLSVENTVTLAEPLAYLPEDRILVQGPVPEDCTLKELARQAIADGSEELLQRLREELTRTGRALAAVHLSGASYGGTATFNDELVEVEEVVDRLSLSVPSLKSAARPVLQRLTDMDLAECPDPVVPAHHDFRPAQVLLHQGAVGFVDFDGACMAEPALDLGRFRAKLRDIGICSLALRDERLSGRQTHERLELLDALCEHFLDAYTGHATVSRQRVLMWETCDLFTSMLHAWTKVRLPRLDARLLVLRHQLRSIGLAHPEKPVAVNWQ